MNMIKSISVLTIATIGLIAPIISITKSAIAEDSVQRQFYCGKVGDPSSKSNLPATIFGAPGTDEGVVLMIWKSEFFGPKYTPQQRCEIATPKFQTALINEGRTLLTNGKDKPTGNGLICAIRDKDQPCDRSTMLFTLKSYQSAEQTIADLEAIFKGQSKQPLYQSTGGNTVIDVSQFLTQK